MGHMLVFTNAADGRDDEFNRWYDDVHLAEVLSVEPFTAAQRFRLADAQVFTDQPFRYAAIYEFDGPAAGAVEALMAASATFDMTDAMASETNVVLVDEIGPRVTA